MTDLNPAAVQVWARLVRVGQNALLRIEGDLKAAGLPPLVWYDLLLEAERAGDDGLTQSDLERAMLLAQYNVSRLVSRLEKEGLVVRRPDRKDGRANRISITSKGRRLRRAIWPIYQRGIEAHFAARLAAKDVGTLNRILGGLIVDQAD